MIRPPFDKKKAKRLSCCFLVEQFLKAVLYFFTSFDMRDGSSAWNIYYYYYLYNELCKTRVLIGLEECVIRV